MVNKSIVVEKNPSDGEFFENADLQKAYNKLCKVTAKDLIMSLVVMRMETLLLSELLL